MKLKTPKIVPGPFPVEVWVQFEFNEAPIRWNRVTFIGIAEGTERNCRNYFAHILQVDPVFVTVKEVSL